MYFYLMLSLSLTPSIAFVSCPCGYGGPCLANWQLLDKRSICTICSNMSEGFYDNCGRIRNHCDPDPCNDGTCVPTFGGYFCRCPVDHYGDNCDVHSAMESSKYKITNEVYTYYQVQPGLDGTNSFYIIHDIGDRDRIYNETGIFVRPIVSFDDQFFYPLRGREYLKMNVKSKCLSDVESYPSLFDKKVCDYVPEGEVWTYKVDVTLYGEAKDRTILRLFGYIPIELVQMGTVLYDVQAISNTETVRMFSHSYNIFTYIFGRAPHQCVMDIMFRGCGHKITLPERMSPGSPHVIKALHKPHACIGVLEINNWWFLQRNISHDAAYDHHGLRDDVPVLVGSANNSRYLRLKPRSLISGLHMIMYALRLRGAPPIHGAAKEFTLYSKCYIEVISVAPNLGILGGENRTSSCYDSITMIIISRDANYAVSDFDITVTCNATATDDECLPRTIAKSSFIKVSPPCGQTYEFSFLLTHKLNITQPVRLVALITFILVQTSVTLTCLHNCYPINSNLRMLITGNTDPYVSEPVTWSILQGNVPLPVTFADKDAFDGISRIVRIDGKLFSNEDAPYTSVLVSLQKGKSRVSTLDITFNVKYRINEFILQRDSNYGYKYTTLSGEDPFMNETEISPMEYWVFGINEIVQEGSLELMTKQFHNLRFLPSFNKVMLCLRGPLRTNYAEECKLPEVVEPFNPSIFGTNFISESFNSGDTPAFLKKVLLHLLNNLVTQAGYLEWRIPVEHRLSILDKILKVDLDFQSDTFGALSVLSIMFYTSDGCLDQDLPMYVDDDRILVDYALAADYLRCTHVAVKALQRVVRTQSEIFIFVKLRKFPFGDIPSIILRSWTLAFFQDGILREHQHDPKTIEDKYVFGEIAYWIRRNAKLMFPTLIQFSDVAGKSSPPFYGLRRAGKGSVRAWFVRSSFRAIQSYTNRSRPWNVTSDDFAEYFFGPVEDGKHVWINKLVIEFFEPVPEWLYREFSLVIVAVRPRPSDNWTSPMMLVDLRRKDGQPIEQLPRGGLYKVSLPAMEKGELAELDYRVAPAFEIAVPVKSGLPAYKYMISYKISVPAEVQNSVWTIYLYYERPFELRVKAFTGSPPEVEEVMLSPVRKSYKTTNFGKKEKHCIEVLAVAEEGGSLPSSFYLGFISNKSLGVLESNHFVTSCRVRGFHGPSDLHSCKSIYKGGYEERKREWNQVPCSCSHFGIVSTVDIWCRFALIFIEPISFVYPLLYNIGGAVSCLALLIGGIGLIIYAVRKEKTRDLLKTLVFAEDSLLTDTNYLVLGVYTGRNPLAGTLSSVAIKITGSNSSSRVHLLTSSVKRTLKSCADDWFIIPTPKPLGKILSVTVWSNYHLTSDWYCSKLMIFDLEASLWYKAEVEQWFRISPSDNSLALSFEVFKVEDMAVDVEKDDTFSYYFVTELCNTHLPLSLFCLNSRSMATCEMRAITYLVKVYGVVLLTWAMQEHIGYLIFNTSDLYPSKLMVLNWNSFLLMFLITMMTRFLTWPMRVWVRSGVVSRMVQRKTTSPTMFFLPDKGAETGRTTRKSTFREKSFASGYVVPRRPDTIVQASDMKGKESREERRSRHYSEIASRMRDKSADRRSTTLALWTKTPWFQERGRHLVAVLLFGPSQFRCVNVTKAVFAVKTGRSRIAFRVVSGLLLIGMLAVITAFEIFTQYWLKTSLSAFLITIGLFLDAVVIEPVIIFLRCLVGYSFCKMSNEETNLWDNEDRNMLIRPLPLSYKRYVEKATSKEYKPLLTREIEAKKLFLKKLHFIGDVAFQLMIIFACCCAYSSIRLTEKQSLFYSIQCSTIGFSEPLHRLVLKSLARAYDVVDSESAIDYVTSVVAESDLTWRNGKFITNDEKRWGKDHYSWPLGSTNVIIVVMSSKAGKFNVPLEFIDYFHEGRVWGDLEFSSQETGPIFIDDERVIYNVTSTDYILGKSRETYPMAGHIVKIEVHPWLEYYIHIRDLMLNVFENEGSFIPRAIIFTINYVNPNLPTLITVDVVIELLTTGVDSARVHVEGTGTYSNTYQITSFLWITIAVITVILFFINVISICKRGLKSFLADSHCRIQGEFFLACFVKSVSSSFYRTEKIKLVKQVASDPADVFTDFHDVFKNDLLDDGAEAAMIFFAVMYIITRIKLRLGKNNPVYSVDLPSRVFPSLIIILLLITYFLSQYEMFHQNELRTFPLVNYFCLKEILPVNNFNRKNYDALIWPCLGFILMMKVCVAYIIFQYRRMSHPQGILTSKLLSSTSFKSFKNAPPFPNQQEAKHPFPDPASKESKTKGPLFHKRVLIQRSLRRTSTTSMSEKLNMKFIF